MVKVSISRKQIKEFIDLYRSTVKAWHRCRCHLFPFCFGCR
ncbi:hypothetical protein HanPSC8_Chr00c109g0804751 [Helianthus annuus]|nr:hypothetical protein HanPSC8_Chr00c109g0804751 [Helianthus annuus]